MKECKRFEKRLPGYLHGELYEKEYHALRAHLDQCAACRAELQAQYEALQLAAKVMQVVPPAARISGWRRQPAGDRGRCNAVRLFLHEFGDGKDECKERSLFRTPSSRADV